MRIRQIRPEFFTDPVTAGLRPATALTYIGLWCVADDGGTLAWDVPQIGALLYPYKPARVREKLVASAGEELVGAGRLIIYACGCARIPTLTDHQKIGGTKSLRASEEHRVHRNLDESRFSARYGSSNGKVGNGTVVAPAPEEPGAAPSEFVEKLAALGVRR